MTASPTTPPRRRFLDHPETLRLYFTPQQGRWIVFTALKLGLKGLLCLLYLYDRDRLHREGVFFLYDVLKILPEAIKERERRDAAATPIPLDSRREAA